MGSVGTISIAKERIRIVATSCAKIRLSVVCYHTIFALSVGSPWNRANVGIAINIGRLHVPKALITRIG